MWLKYVRDHGLCTAVFTTLVRVRLAVCPCALVCLCPVHGGVVVSRLMSAALHPHDHVTVSRETV